MAGDVRTAFVHELCCSCMVQQVPGNLQAGPLACAGAQECYVRYCYVPARYGRADAAV